MIEPGQPETNGEAQSNRYSVRVNQWNAGWGVEIVDLSGNAAFRRSCADEAEARTFASTVQQHIYWLSPAKFAQYYRLKGAEA